MRRSQNINGPTTMQFKDRYDAHTIPKAPEAMTAITPADHALRAELIKNKRQKPNPNQTTKTHETSHSTRKPPYTTPTPHTPLNASS